MYFQRNLANAIRMLSIDAIEKAQSGHPGAPMGMADIAEVLWRKHLNHNPTNPNWFNRDRFILSNGHCSMLLYSLLHLSGYRISIEDIKNFRQLNSNTPGHPEYSHTEGVEVTTGPLGQGIANAVGFAIAEKILSNQFNKKNLDIINHYTYVFAGDGCLMEGISHESCSLAGTMKLGKLIIFYDDNGISIDGKVKNWFTDNTLKRFESYNWQVIDNVDGHDSSEINKVIEISKKEKNKPSLIICKTIIGFGSPNKSGTNLVHGAPLGKKEIDMVRKKLNWHYPPFFIPEEIYNVWNSKKIGEKKETLWLNKFNAYKEKYPKLASEFERRIHKKLPYNWSKITKSFTKKINNNINNISTRQASQNSIEYFCKILPEHLGGSADLTPSNLTLWSGSKNIIDDFSGNYIHYGVREFGMTAIANGISLHGGFIPYTSTFLVFSDYARNAIRMSAIMNIHHIMVYTHDSIGLGEDGPTHQPIEQLSSLRNIPNLYVWRPSDQLECVIAWQNAIERNNGSTALILSRQNLIQQNRNKEQVENIKKGGYILKENIKTDLPDVIIISTGSELNIAIAAYQKLILEGYKIRVVSMPCTNIFDRQDKAYKESILPDKVKKRIAIEAGSSNFWYQYVGLEGKVIGIDNFGYSAPAHQLFNKFGFNVENVIKKIKYLIK